MTDAATGFAHRTMASYQCVAPPLRLFHGPASLDQLGKELDRAKAFRAVIVCGASLSRNGDLLARIRRAAGERCAGVFAGVRAHSPIPSVQAACEELRRLGADAVVAAGGGSAIVTARAASILLAEGKAPAALCTAPDGRGGLRSPRLAADKLPQFIVPTTPTTAAVKAGSAVFDPASGERLALFDPKTRAQAIFIDPDMMLSAPTGLVASAGINAFSTAIEGLVSRSGNPVSDALLMHAVRLLARHLAAPRGLEDAGVRGEATVAALLCGQGTDHTGAGVTTVLGHALGARFAVENGTVNAIILPHALEYNAGHAAGGLVKVAAALGIAGTEPAMLVPAIADAARRIFRANGMPLRLRDIGIRAGALRDVAAAGMDDWFLRGNPRAVKDAGELLEILEKAW